MFACELELVVELATTGPASLNNVTEPRKRPTQIGPFTWLGGFYAASSPAGRHRPELSPKPALRIERSVLNIRSQVQPDAKQCEWVQGSECVSETRPEMFPPPPEAEPTGTVSVLRPPTAQKLRVCYLQTTLATEDQDTMSVCVSMSVVRNRWSDS